MNAFNIRNTFHLKDRLDWPEVYFVIDLHGTIIPSGKHSGDKTDELHFYPGAEEVLLNLTNRKDIFTILWTSTPWDRLPEVLTFFKTKGIVFTWINENPHAKNTPRSDFSKKFYFNVLLEDRAGFEPETDWFLVKSELEAIGRWNLPDSLWRKGKRPRGSIGGEKAVPIVAG